MHDRHLVRDREGLFLVVCHQQRCHSCGGEQTGDRLAGGGAQPGVERAERFVEQHQHRVSGERTRQRDALLLTSGQLVRATRRVRRVQRNGFEKLGDAGTHLAAGITAQSVRDVLPDGQVREKRTVLRDVADTPAMRCHRTSRARHLSSGDGDRSPVGCLEPGDEAQQRGLAAARRSENGGCGARWQIEVDVVQHRVSVERLGESLDVEDGGRHSAATFNDWRNSTNVTGMASTTSASA